MKLRRGFLLIGFLVAGMITGFAHPADFPLLKGPYLGQKPPGKIPCRFKPDGFRRGRFAEPFFLFFSSGRECLFTASGGLYYTRLKNERWTDPINTNTCGGYADFAPNLSRDGTQLFFNSLDRPLPRGIKKSLVAIWRAEKTNTGWSKPEYLGFGGMYATVSKDGDIYFTLRKNGVDCLAMKKYEDGKYQDTEIISAPVFSNKYHDQHPCISPDGSYLIFDSENRPKKNRCALFVSFRNKDTSWTEPVNLGDFIKQDNAAMARITCDGNYLFYNDRNGSNWWVSTKIIEKLKPNIKSNNHKKGAHDDM